jgi:hypothetical protein
MKQFRIFLVSMALGLIAAGAPLFAQASTAPSSQLGIGLNTSGGTVQYAVTPSIQIGFEASFFSQSSSGTSTTGYGLGPYARFLLEGTVNPFIQAGFRAEKRGGGTISSLYAGFGLEYFFSRNVGVFALADVLTLTLSDPSATTISFVGNRVGVEWYFDR